MPPTFRTIFGPKYLKIRVISNFDWKIEIWGFQPNPIFFGGSVELLFGHFHLELTILGPKWPFWDPKYAVNSRKIRAQNGYFGSKIVNSRWKKPNKSSTEPPKKIGFGWKPQISIFSVKIQNNPYFQVFWTKNGPKSRWQYQYFSFFTVNYISELKNDPKFEIVLIWRFEKVP